MILYDVHMVTSLSQCERIQYNYNKADCDTDFELGQSAHRGYRIMSDNIQGHTAVARV